MTPALELMGACSQLLDLPFYLSLSKFSSPAACLLESTDSLLLSWRWAGLTTANTQTRRAPPLLHQALLLGVGGHQQQKAQRRLLKGLGEGRQQERTNRAAKAPRSRERSEQGRQEGWVFCASLPELSAALLCLS